MCAWRDGYVRVKRWEDGYLHPGAEKKLGETNFSSTFILDFQALELWETRLLLLNPPLLVFRYSSPTQLIQGDFSVYQSILYILRKNDFSEVFEAKVGD